MFAVARCTLGCVASGWVLVRLCACIVGQVVRPAGGWEFGVQVCVVVRACQGFGPMPLALRDCANNATHPERREWSRGRQDVTHRLGEPA